MKSLEHYRNRPNTVEAEKLELIAKVLRLPGHKVKRTKSCITITFTAESGAKCVARCPNLESLRECVDIFVRAAEKSQISSNRSWL